MALSANTIVEVRPGGNDTNGGGYVSGSTGLDYSQKDAKNDAGFSSSDKSATDAVGNGTTTLTSATANFSTQIVGNIIYLQGGTGSLAAGWYHVSARASTTSITIDRAVAAGTGITMNIGGGLASLGMAGGYGLVTGARIFIQQGTYTISSATANISGGCFSSSLSLVVIRGYGSQRNDLTVAPLLQASGISTFTVVTLSGATSSIFNVGVDCAGLTSSRGFIVRNVIYKCYCLSPTNTGIIRSTNLLATLCYVTGATTAAAFQTACMDCYAGDGTVTAFALAAGEYAIRCIADSNSGASSSGFTCAGLNNLTNCVAYNNGNVGYLSNGTAVVYQDCIAESNAGAGFNLNSQEAQLLINYGLVSDTISGSLGKGTILEGGTIGASSFFVDAPNRNFALNKTPGAGLDAWILGFPGTLPIGGTGYLAMGALQPSGGPAAYAFP